MKKSAGLVSITIGLVTAIQIIGQIVVARIFGARIELDAFVSAVTIPTMLTSVIAGTLNDAFLPLLKKRQSKSENEGNMYFVKIALLMSMVLVVVTTCAYLFSLPILQSLFGARGMDFILKANGMMQWMIYTLPFTLVGTFSSSYLYSKGKFINSSLSYLLGSILNLAIIIALSSTFGIWSMVIAYIAAILLQFFITYPYNTLGYITKSIPHLFEKESKAEFAILLVAWIPLIISSIAVRFDSILIRSFSARLPEGYIVYTNLVSKLFSGLVGITTIGLQIVFFPHLLDLVHAKDFTKAKQKVQKAKLLGVGLTIFTVLVIVFISPFFMRLLLTGGKFSSKNVEILISLFPYFIIPAVGWGVSQLFFQPIIAIGKQHLLTIMNVVAVAISWAAAMALYSLYGGLYAISGGLIILTFTGIVGAEIVWQQHLKKHLS